MGVVVNVNQKISVALGHISVCLLALMLESKINTLDTEFDSLCCAFQTFDDWVKILGSAEWCGQLCL